MNKYFFSVLVLFPLLLISCSESRYPDPLSPEEALETFQLNDDFKIETFAAEPNVFEPVSMEFDEQGNAYVVEMPNYAFKSEMRKREGRIRLLRDTDGNGRIDKSTVFADSLFEATSILPWKGGLIVTAAPDILYFKDTNGDFKADTKEVLFSGFSTDKTSAQITSLRFSVDNWIYATNLGQPGEVKFNRNPAVPPISMRGADFRFRLDRGQFEQETGRGQFGQDINDWGHRFLTHNTRHIQHAVIPWRYMHRHPYLPSTASAVNISDHDLLMYQLTPPPYWRAERTMRRNKEYQERNLDRTEHADDHFTGSSGGTIYQGDAFPDEYYGNVFTGDVAGNLVHRDILTPLEDSPTFVAQRGETEKNREFLASTDPWFRPVNFTLGPDGNLYVLDMYRQHIEAPNAIPDDLKKDMNFLNGNEYGRIYRILPVNSESREKPSPKFKNRNAHEYVELLSHPDRWWRLQAQRLLLELQEKSVVPDVEKIFREHEDPRARLHALYVLEGLNALNAKLIKEAMNDAHPGIRENGIILAEQFPELLPELLESVNDPAIRVAFQGTLSLGQFNNQQVETILARVVEEYGQDPWFRTAVLSSEAGSSIGLIEKIANNGSFFEDVESYKTTFLKDFAYVVSSRNQEKQVISFLNLLSKPAIKKEKEWRISAVEGLTKGWKSDGGSEHLIELLKRIETDSINVEIAIQDLKKFYSFKREI